MKHSIFFSSWLAILCLAVPAVGHSSDRHQDVSSWHGRFHGPHFHFYGPWLPPLPFYYGPFPYPAYGYYGPSVGVSVSSEPAAAYRGARMDDRSDDLTVDVQRALQHDGYYRGEADGDIGAGTRAAIRQYQYDHQLEVTGRIDRGLLRSLGID